MRSLCAAIFLSLLSPAWVQGRQVALCVLNDSRAPVEEKLIDELIDYASRSYAGQVGIRFREVERHSYRLDPFAQERRHLENIRRSCRRGEAALVFSSRIVAASEWSSRRQGAAGSSHQRGHLLGLGSTSGYAILTSVPYAQVSRDAAGRPKIYGAILHELAHLFVDEHLEDERSFLYQHVNRFNQWTPETRRAILRNREIRWRLKPEPPAR